MAAAKRRRRERDDGRDDISRELAKEPPGLPKGTLHFDSKGRRVRPRETGKAK